MSVKQEMVTLYKDWLSTKSAKEIKALSSILEQRTIKAYNDVFKYMGADGNLLKGKLEEGGITNKKVIVEAIKDMTSLDGSVVKEIDQLYIPIDDRSNRMISAIDAADEKDIIIRIRQAVVARDFSIAEELLKAAWPNLSIFDREFLMGFVRDMGAYDTNPDLKVTSSDLKIMKADKEIKTKTKKEYIDGFILTAKENMKIS